MTNKTGRRNFVIVLIIGVMLCIISILCLSVLVYSVADSIMKKNKLEAIGAAVNMRFTVLFYVDIAVLFLSGIFGVIFIRCFTENKRNKIVQEPKLPVTDIVPPDKNDIPTHITKDNERTDTYSPIGVKTGGGLRINYGSSGKANGNVMNEAAERSDNISDTSSTASDSSFFSSGGEL